MDSKIQMDKLFAPSTVAVIGASGREDSIGYNLVKNIVDGGFEGEVYPINPKYETVFDKKCYKSISQLPCVPDLTLLRLAAGTWNWT